MPRTLSSKKHPRDGGRFTERPIAMSAEAVMNATALIDDAMRGLYRARIAIRNAAAASERVA